MSSFSSKVLLLAIPILCGFSPSSKLKDSGLVIYHADRDKGKYDLHGGRRQVLVEWEGQNQPEIELKDASGKFHNI